MKIPERISDWLIERAMRTPFSHIPGYMERYWLIPYQEGDRQQIAARIHHILRSDNDREFHDHPWPYLTVLLRGSYTEVTPVYDRSGIFVEERRVRYEQGSVLRRAAKSWHRLEVEPGQTVWTLFITGPYQQRWGFMLNPANKVYWRDLKRPLE